LPHATIGRGRTDESCGGLLWVESESPKRIGFGPDAKPASPATAGGVGPQAGSMRTASPRKGIQFLEGDPVDAALTQSSSHPRRGRRASGHVLV